MPVLSHEIDPEIAKALNDTETSLVAKPASDSGIVDPATTDAGQRALTLLGKQGALRGDSLTEKVVLFLSSAGFAGLGVMPFISIGWKVGAWVVAVFLLLAALGTTVRKLRRNREPKEGVISYPVEALEALFPLLTLSPTERRYTDILLILAREKSPIDESARAELLTQINGLLTDHRMLAARRAEITVQGSDLEREQMVRERKRLLREARESTDPVVQATKEQSAQILATRLDDSETVLTMAKRMEAQEEAIYETMGALHAALMRQRLAPTRLESTDTSHLRETIDQTRQQTQAIEQAVVEVLALDMKN